MKRLFGTDGIRGQADQYPLDSPTVARLGFSLVRVLGKESDSIRILIGRDPRESGFRIEQDLVRGIQKANGTAIAAGVLPTPGVAFLTRSCGFAAGVVISASHNPYTDNGIKVFSKEGFKIPDPLEEEIEKELLAGTTSPEPGCGGVGELRTDEHLRVRYMDYLLSTLNLSEESKKGLTVVIDSANGSASGIACELFRRLGAHVIPVGNEPNGRNINLNCGSLHAKGLAEIVVREKADLGIAYDGDADRCILVDEKGSVRDGDFLLALFALWMDGKNRLKNREVVATVMSNLGLEKYLESKNIKLIRTSVGDKYVLEQLIARGSRLGGEQSGHIIFLDEATTGDGLLTSLKAFEIMTARGQPLSELCRGMEKYPQVLRNVTVTRKKPIRELPGLAREIRRVEEALGPEGRCLVRYSGTEPILRIMMEGKAQEEINAYAERIAVVVSEELG